MAVRLADGSEIETDTPMALGNPQNPMSWDDMRAKFDALVEPVLGKDKAAELFGVLRHFDTGALDEYVRLVKA
jgi:2-methylcitrate dehydratase PrpD